MHSRGLSNSQNDSMGAQIKIPGNVWHSRLAFMMAVRFSIYHSDPPSHDHSGNQEERLHCFWNGEDPPIEQNDRELHTGYSEGVYEVQRIE